MKEINFFHHVVGGIAICFIYYTCAKYIFRLYKNKKRIFMDYFITLSFIAFTVVGTHLFLKTADSPIISHIIENKGDIGMLTIVITDNNSGVKLVAGNPEKLQNDVVEGTSIPDVLRKYADDIEKLEGTDIN